ncbi:hypothetical protein Taro_016730 [Colocasia esculenta]|uniref:Uncharacterized protein n=1 Tax=Colocasia esculenta TaxID=4460 RepID=A0A843UX59_COLES|nr:hypothetical protein [Colocasia esculenta]
MTNGRFAQNPPKNCTELRGERETFRPGGFSPATIKGGRRPRLRGGFLKSENQSKALGRDCKAVWERVCKAALENIVQGAILNFLKSRTRSIGLSYWA